MNLEADSSFTARELEKALGLSARQAQRHAKAEDWPYVEESHRGGQRRRYPLEGLPLDIAAKALRWRAADAAARFDTHSKPAFDYDSEALWREAAKRSAKHREEGEFRAQALREVATLMESEGLPFLKAARRVAARTGRSAAAIRDWHYGRKVRGTRIRGARDYAPADRAAALIPRHANSGRQRKDLPGGLGKLFDSLYLHGRKPTVADSYRRVRQAAEDAGMDTAGMPSLRTVQSRAKEIPAGVRAYKRESPLSATKLAPKLRVDRSGLRVGEAVSGDGLTLDRILVQFPDGEIRSPVVWVFQDEKSRSVTAWKVGKTESTTLFRHAMQEQAKEFLPERMTLDNTMAASNKAMTAGTKGRRRFKDLPEDPPGLLKRLNIEVHRTNPDRRTMNPGAKLCERAFGIGGLHDEIANHPRIRHLGRAKGRPVPWAEFEAAWLEAVRAFNEREGRRDRDSAGRSYRQAFEAGLADPANPVRKANPYQLEMLERVPQAARVSSEAWEVRVRIAPGDRGVLRYTSPELEPWMGKEVTVLYNPDDTTRDAFVEDPEGRRICRAERLADAAYGSADAAGQTMRRKKGYLKKSKEAAEALELLNESELASRFPPKAGDPSLPAKVVTADFDMPAAKAVAAGGARDAVDPLEGYIPQQSEEEFQAGLEAYERLRKRKRQWQDWGGDE